MKLNSLESREKLLRMLIPVLLFIISISCRETGGREKQEKSSINNSIEVAHRISIEKFSDYTKITIINPWQGANQVNMTCFLVRRGSAPPQGLDSSMIIMVPVRSIVCMSTTHVAMIEALGEAHTIAGMSGTGFIYSPEVRNLADKGLIRDVGYEANLNKELILKIHPDITMIYGVGSESSGYVGKLQELGIRVIYNADYLETDPLGKTEWLKLFGALYCREELADSLYNAEVQQYNDLKSFISRNTTGKPLVLLGLPFKDTWFVSPGNSFISSLIEDAGGEYLWKETKSSVSMPFGLENVYLKAIKADYWLNIGTVSSKTEISAVDPRLNALACFKKGNLYNNNNRITDEGGNDFWESGTLFPHIILKDIASILHPHLFPGYEPFYYRKVI